MRLLCCAQRRDTPDVGHTDCLHWRRIAWGLWLLPMRRTDCLHHWFLSLLRLLTARLRRLLQVVMLLLLRLHKLVLLRMGLLLLLRNLLLLLRLLRLSRHLRSRSTSRCGRLPEG